MAPMKGVRKPRNARPAGIRIGRRTIPPEGVIAGLLALMYAWFLIGGAYEGSSFLVQLIYFALYAVMIFLLRGTRRLYSRMGSAFLVLAIPPLLWDAAAYMGYRPALPMLSWDVYVGIASLLLGIGLTVGLLSYEKETPAGAYIRPGDLRTGVRDGLAAFVASAVLAAALAYISYGAGSADLSRLLPAVGALIVFSIACSIAEELWFRGLLLSRLVPVTGANAALIIQAFAFAAYAAVFLFMLNPVLEYAAVVFAAALVLGLALGWMTLKNNSLLAAVLSHAGIYLILALPIFAAFF